MKLKKIHKGFYGNGNKYQFNETVFRIHRSNSFFVFDEAIGINSGQQVFYIYGHVDFNHGMREFKKWLLRSDYIKPKPSSAIDATTLKK